MNDRNTLQEMVVLVDEQNVPIGTAPKDTVHTKQTPLHRAFSLFLFNDKKEILLTKRASTKKTFPGVWTNAVCGHPAPGEETADAVKRRVPEELGIEIHEVKHAAPYRYRFTDINGIVENEICPIYVGFTENDPNPSFGEVDDWKRLDWQEFLRDIQNNPSIYSPWSIEEANIIESLKLIV